jgi:hypothetical protein
MNFTFHDTVIRHRKKIYLIVLILLFSSLIKFRHRRRLPIGDTVDYYPGVAPFESRPRYRLSLLKFLFFLSPFRLMPR